MARKTEKCEKWKMHIIDTNTVWNGTSRETLKELENEKHTLRTLIMARNTEKNCKMRNTHCRTSHMARNSKKYEKWDIHIVGPWLRREKWKMWKRHKHCRTLNMARILKNMENETHTVWPGIWQETLKNMKNEKCTV
jgi:hypothetical protein